MTGLVRRLRRTVGEGPSDAPGGFVDGLGRVGLVAYGVVHLLVAWLAAETALGIPDDPASLEGAVATISDTGGGAVVLVLVTAGLLAFAVWQLTAVVLGFRDVEGGELFRKRAGATAKAIAMTALATITAGFVDGRGDRDEPEARTVTAELLALPAGRVLVGALAATVLGIAVAMTYTGVRRTFLNDLDMSRCSEAGSRAVAGLGVAGHLSRALAIGLVGVGIGAAAVVIDADRAVGLDAALRGLASTTAGGWLLGVVAAGFAAYGLFCFADAALRRY